MLDISKQRNVMFNLITEVYSSSILGTLLGFKGGTMAYFFYGLDRFSVDLDFDLLYPEKGNLIPSLLRPILLKHGIIKDESTKYFTYFYLLGYEKTQRTIKIEISKRNDTNISYVIANFYGTDVKIPPIEDAFATKLLACTTRKSIAYRDFYDVLFYLKKGVKANEKIIKSITKKNIKSYLLTLKRFIENKVANRSVIHGIGELVNERQKEWIRNNFKKELLGKLQFYIDHQL